MVLLSLMEWLSWDRMPDGDKVWSTTCSGLIYISLADPLSTTVTLESLLRGSLFYDYWDCVCWLFASRGSLAYYVLMVV